MLVPAVFAASTPPVKRVVTRTVEVMAVDVADREAGRERDRPAAGREVDRARDVVERRRVVHRRDRNGGRLRHAREVRRPVVGDRPGDGARRVGAEVGRVVAGRGERDAAQTSWKSASVSTALMVDARRRVVAGAQRGRNGKFGQFRMSPGWKPPVIAIVAELSVAVSMSLGTISGTVSSATGAAFSV